MAWLDQFFVGLTGVQIAGVPLPQRPILDFGSGFTASDDQANNRTIVNATGGGSSDATSIQGVPVLTGTPATFQFMGSLDGINWGPVTITSDMVSAGLSVTLSGGSGGSFEVGNTWTLTGLTASPACNAVGVTAATLQEIINSVAGTSVNVLSQGNPLSGANLPHTSYTRSGSGDIVDLQLTMTKGGVTKASSLGSVRGTFLDRYYVGSGSGGAGTSATSSGNNAALVGDTGTLTGTIGAFGVGTTFSIPAGAAAYWYLWVLHTSSPMTFKAAGAPFAMTRVGSNVSYSNQFAVSHNFDLYVSNQLTQAYTVVRDT